MGSNACISLSFSTTILKVMLKILKAIEIIHQSCSTPNDTRKIAAFAKEIGPDSIHLNTECKDTSVYYAAINSKDKWNAHV